MELVGLYDGSKLDDWDRGNWIEMPDRVWDDKEIMRMARSVKVKMTRFQVRNVLRWHLWICMESDPEGAGHDFQEGQLFDSRILKDIIMEQFDDVIIDAGPSTLNYICETKGIKTGYQYLKRDQFTPEQVAELEAAEDVETCQHLLDTWFDPYYDPDGVPVDL